MLELKTISEFRKDERIDGFYIIKSAEVKTNSTNRKYMDFTFGDSTGEINGKLWEYKEGDENSLTTNVLVKVRGMVSAWQNSLQLKVEKIRITCEEDGLYPSDFVPVAPYDPEDMYQLVLDYADRIKNNDIKNIVYEILNNCIDEIMYFPAAKKNHHSIRSGLLYHITTMLKSGDKLSEIYSFLDTDLLFGGIILHDIAKLYEMNSSELGIVSEYTVEGQLLGHIIQGIKLIETAGLKVGADKEITVLLEHMVLSHHYEPDYGSPKKPAIPEAEMLHFLDDMDAKMYDMKKALENTKQGEFSENIWSLDKRRIYKAKNI